MFPIRLREGFKDQLLSVMPQKVLEGFIQHPLMSALMPTAMGWYPNARFHYCEREKGAPEHILAVCISGEGWFQVNEGYDTLSPNEAMLIPRDVYHVYGARDTNPWSLHWVHFVGSSADYFMRQLPRDKFKLAVAPEAITPLKQLFSECYSAFASSYALERMIYASQTLHHLLALLFFNNPAYTPALQNGLHSVDATLVFLQQNIHRTLPLTEMAEQAEMSVSHFSRIFKKQTGFSPTNYFIHLKMQHACMLLSTRTTIREIAYQLGYEDPYYFSHSFKKVIGQSPTEYRSRSLHRAAQNDTV